MAISVSVAVWVLGAGRRALFAAGGGGGYASRCSQGAGRDPSHDPANRPSWLRSLAQQRGCGAPFAGLGRGRRWAKDEERALAISKAGALLASLRILIRRLARPCYATETFESGSELDFVQNYLTSMSRRSRFWRFRRGPVRAGARGPPCLRRPARTGARTSSAPSSCPLSLSAGALRSVPAGP